MEDDVRQRIRELLDYNKISQNRLAGGDKALQKRLSSQINGSTAITYKTISSILDSFPLVSVEWLLRGDGEMYKTSSHDNVPLIPVKVVGGMLTGYSSDGTLMNDCERVVSPFSHADFAMEVHGDSMSPEFPCGSRIFIKRIKDGTFIKWGDVYVLDTCNGAVVKEVQPSENDDFIRCVSTNPNGRYKPFDVSKNDIYGIYMVLGCLIIK